MAIEKNVAHYKIEVKHPETDALLRTEEPVTEKTYSYTFEKNYTDNAGEPTRSFRLSVYPINDFGEAGDGQTIFVDNPPPPVPFFKIVPKNGFLKLEVASGPGTGIEGFLVWASNVQNFTPAPGNLMWQGPGEPILAVVPGETIYFRIAAYDSFGLDEYIISEEYSSDIPLAEIDLTPINEELDYLDGQIEHYSERADAVDIRLDGLEAVTQASGSNELEDPLLINGLTGWKANNTVLSTRDDFPSKAVEAVVIAGGAGNFTTVTLPGRHEVKPNVYTQIGVEMSLGGKATSAALQVQFYDAAETQIDAVEELDEKSSGRLEGIVQAPENAAFAIITVVGKTTTGGNCTLILYEPFIAGASASQTAVDPFIDPDNPSVTAAYYERISTARGSREITGTAYETDRLSQKAVQLTQSTAQLNQITQQLNTTVYGEDGTPGLQQDLATIKETTEDHTLSLESLKTTVYGEDGTPGLQQDLATIKETTEDHTLSLESLKTTVYGPDGETGLVNRVLNVETTNDEMSQSLESVSTQINGPAGILAQVDDLDRTTGDLASSLQSVRYTVEGSDGNGGLAAQVSDLSQASDSFAQRITNTEYAIEGGGGYGSGLLSRVSGLESANDNFAQRVLNVSYNAGEGTESLSQIFQRVSSRSAVWLAAAEVAGAEARISIEARSAAGIPSTRIVLAGQTIYIGEDKLHEFSNDGNYTVWNTNRTVRIMEAGRVDSVSNLIIRDYSGNLVFDARKGKIEDTALPDTLGQSPKACFGSFSRTVSYDSGLATAGSTSFVDVPSSGYFQVSVSGGIVSNGNGGTDLTMGRVYLYAVEGLSEIGLGSVLVSTRSRETVAADLSSLAQRYSHDYNGSVRFRVKINGTGPPTNSSASFSGSIQATWYPS